MPRPLNQSPLEAGIQSIVARAAVEIGAAVRASISDEIQRLVAGGVGPSPPGVVRRGPGRPRKEAAAVQAPAPKSAAKKPGRKGSRGLQTYPDADLARALDTIRSKPGLQPSSYRAAAKMDERLWGNVIHALKKQGRIRVTGKARSTSYVAV